MWFSEVALVENPGREELQAFVRGTASFLNIVVETPDFRFLWEHDSGLQRLAMQTFFGDIMANVSELLDAVPEIPESALIQHGLLGRPLRFKLRVLDSIGSRWESIRGSLSIRAWFKKIVDAIDAVLDSLISAAGGVGSAIKEFKDALGALAPTEE